MNTRPLSLLRPARLAKAAIHPLVLATCLALGLRPATLHAQGNAPAITGTAGTVTFYTTPGEYAAATASNTTYAFSSGSTTTVNEGPTYTNGPLTFGSSQSVFLYNDGGYGNGVSYLAETQAPETVSLAGASGLSFVLGTYAGAQSIAIAVNGVAVTTLTTDAGHPTTGFIGFTDTVPITSLTFTNTSNAEIDVISFQASGVVPEPATWLGGALLLGTAGLMARRRLVWDS